MTGYLLNEYRKLIKKENKRLNVVRMILIFDHPHMSKQLQELMIEEPDLCVGTSTFSTRYEEWYKKMHNLLEHNRLVYYKAGKQEETKRIEDAIEALNKKNDFINDYVNK